MSFYPNSDELTGSYQLIQIEVFDRASKKLLYDIMLALLMENNDT